MEENQTPSKPPSQTEITQPAPPAPPKSKRKLWIIISIVVGVIFLLFTLCGVGTALYFWYQKNQAKEAIKQADKSIAQAEKNWNKCNQALFPQEENPNLGYQANITKVEESAKEGKTEAQSAQQDLEKVKESGASASFKKYANLKLKTCTNLIAGFELMKKKTELVKTKVAQDKLSTYLGKHNAGIDAFNSAIDLANKNNFGAAQAKAQEAQTNLQESQKLVEEAYQLDKVANLSEVIAASQKESQAASSALQMTQIGKGNISQYNALVDQTNTLTKEANALLQKETNSFAVLNIAYSDKIDKVQSKIETYYNQIKGFDEEAKTLKKSKLKLK